MRDLGNGLGFEDTSSWKHGIEMLVTPPKYNGTDSDLEGKIIYVHHLTT